MMMMIAKTDSCWMEKILSKPIEIGTIFRWNVVFQKKKLLCPWFCKSKKKKHFRSAKLPMDTITISLSFEIGKRSEIILFCYLYIWCFLYFKILKRIKVHSNNKKSTLVRNESRFIYLLSKNIYRKRLRLNAEKP